MVPMSEPESYRPRRYLVSLVYMYASTIENPPKGVHPPGEKSGVGEWMTGVPGLEDADSVGHARHREDQTADTVGVETLLVHGTDNHAHCRRQHSALPTVQPG
jgi:hypothetical protein